MSRMLMIFLCFALIFPGIIICSSVEEVFKEVHSEADLPAYLKNEYSFKDGQLQMTVKFKSTPTALVVPTKSVLRFTIDTGSLGIKQRLRIWNLRNTCSVLVDIQNNKATLMTYKRDTFGNEFLENKKLKPSNTLSLTQPYVQMQIGYAETQDGGQKHACLFERTMLNETHSFISLDVGILDSSFPINLIFEKDVTLLAPKTMYDLLTDAKSTNHPAIPVFIVFLFNLLLASMCC